MTRRPFLVTCIVYSQLKKYGSLHLPQCMGKTHREDWPGSQWRRIHIRPACWHPRQPAMGCEVSCLISTTDGTTEATHLGVVANHLARGLAILGVGADVATGEVLDLIVPALDPVGEVAPLAEGAAPHAHGTILTSVGPISHFLFELMVHIHIPLFDPKICLSLTLLSSCPQMH